MGIGGVVPMDVPEDVQVHLENNAAWSDSVKNEKRRNLRKERNGQTVNSDTESPRRRAEGSDQSRQEADRKAGRVGGKCHLGQETKGTTGKDKQEAHSQAKSRSSQKVDNNANEELSKMLGVLRRDSTPSKRKAVDDLTRSNPEKLARTETKHCFPRNLFREVPRETPQAKGKVALQQRTTGDHSQRKYSKKPRDKRECCSNNKKYSELLSLVKNMKEEWETERKERDLREEMLKARIEELERREKERRTSE